MSNDLSPNVSQTACLRCREQKLRCSRELPQCARCAKLDAACVFPEPADRKLIAIQRESRKRKRTSSNILDENPQSTSKLLASEPFQQPSTGSTRIDDGETQSILSMDQDMQLLLQDTYFVSMFNSSLIFHRPTFEKDYANGCVAIHILQAMYAMAICLLPSSSFDQDLNYKLQNFGDLKTLSRSWALEAGKTALTDIDSPTLPAVQTCLILILYWFSAGDYTRNQMFSGVAYRAIRCMLQDSKMESPAVLDLDETQWLLSEQVRRNFWAAWQVNWANFSDQYAVSSVMGTNIMAIPLPTSEKAFLEGRREDFGTLGGGEDTSANMTPSILAETMKLTLLWARIRDYLEGRQSHSKEKTWGDAFVSAMVLYDELSNWKRRLHHSLQYSRQSLSEHLFAQQQPMYVLLWASYHQCCLVVHASLIPSLSALPQDTTPREAARVSAEIAFDHAHALSTLVADLISLDAQPTRIPPFVGYSMYAAATIHCIVVNRGRAMREKARNALASCLNLFRRMMPYWAILSKLWERFLRLYEVQMLYNSSGQGDDGSRPEHRSSSSNLVGGEAEDGSINEVVNDSIIYFSLRRVEKGINTAAAGTRSSDVEKAALVRSLEALIEDPGADLGERGDLETPLVAEDTSGVYSLRPLPSRESPSQEVSSAMEGYTMSGLIEANPSETQPFDDLPNWWEWDMTADAEAQITFEDLFGMDFTF